MKPHYLYKITNTVNGKMYIGVTKNPKERERQHFKHRHPDTMSTVKYAIDKYGLENFTFEVICIGSRDYILELEQKAIVSYNTTAPHGYNISPGGEGGAASSVKKRSDDTPLFITGFWFPNRRTALSVIDIGIGTLYARLKDGTLGDVQINLRRPTRQPVYVGGFWFTTSKVASQHLNITVGGVNKRILEGYIEQSGSRNHPRGEDHPCYGKTGAACCNSKPIIIEGIEYVSQTEAVQMTGYSPAKIYRRLKANHPDFQYKGIQHE